MWVDWSWKTSTRASEAISWIHAESSASDPTGFRSETRCLPASAWPILLEGLTDRLTTEGKREKRWGESRPVQPSPFLPLVGDDDELMHSSLFYACLQRFLQAGDLLVADTGSCLLQLNAHRLPAAVAMESQTLWGSIGWGTPPRSVALWLSRNGVWCW